MISKKTLFVILFIFMISTVFGQECDLKVINFEKDNGNTILQYDQIIDQLEEATRFERPKILKDWDRRCQPQGNYKDFYGERDKVYEVEVDDYSDKIENIHLWVSQAAESWRKVKENPLVKETMDR